MTQYPTDLTEKQWQVIKNILRAASEEPKTSDLKEIKVNDPIPLLITRTGAVPMAYASF